MWNVWPKKSKRIQSNMVSSKSLAQKRNPNQNRIFKPDSSTQQKSEATLTIVHSTKATLTIVTTKSFFLNLRTTYREQF